MKDFFFTVHALVYRFYMSRGNSDPYDYSLPLVALFQFMNIFSMTLVAINGLPFPLHQSKIAAALLYFILTVINYFLLYYKDAHHNIFRRLLSNDRYPRLRNLAIWYMIVTVFIFIGTFFIVKMRQ